MNYTLYEHDVTCKAHHRSCKTIKSFDKYIVNDLNSQDINEDHIDIDSDVCRETPPLKTSIINYLLMINSGIFYRIF